MKLPGHIALEGGGLPVPVGPSDTELANLIALMPAAGPSHESVALARKAMEQALRGYAAIVSAVAGTHRRRELTNLQKDTESAAAAGNIAQRYRDSLAAAWAALAETREGLPPEETDRIQRIDQSMDLLQRMDKLLLAKVKQCADRVERTLQIMALEAA